MRTEKKNSDENNRARRYCADSNNINTLATRYNVWLTSIGIQASSKYYSYVRERVLSKCYSHQQFMDTTRCGKIK